MIEVAVKSVGGEVVRQLQLDERVWGITPNTAVLHQAVVTQLANQRKGTHATKTRGMVAGGGKKPWRQNGTGRARQGSTRAPHWRGGGIVFGPHPRSYHKDLPRKMRRLALRSALSVKASEGAVAVVDGFALDEPKTKAMAELLRGLGVEADQNVLIVLQAANDLVARSTNNLPWAKIVLAQNLNLYDIFTHDRLVIAKDAIGLLEETLA
jgi:large subunit ribosomal protein L4